MRVLVIMAAMMVGCAERQVFVGLGNGVAVPATAIDDYVDEHGVTRNEARARMAAAAHERKVAQHAEKFGVSLEEAERQIAHEREVVESER